MIKLLFLISTLFIADPDADHPRMIHEMHQVIGQTCDEAKADFKKLLDQHSQEMHLIMAAMDCQEIPVDTSKTQNGST